MSKNGDGCSVEAGPVAPVDPEDLVSVEYLPSSDSEEEEQDEPVEPALQSVDIHLYALEILGLHSEELWDKPPGFWERILVKQTRRLAARMHPDKGGNRQQFEEMQRSADLLLEAAAAWKSIRQAGGYRGMFCCWTSGFV